MKRVLSLWLPMWPIDRLRRAMPAAVPSDKPLALVESGVHGLSITAVNDVAAREGVHAGMSLADARAAFPHLLSHRAEIDKDRLALLRLARWAGRYGPNRHADGQDGLWIDVTGVAHLYGGETALLADCVRRLKKFGVEARAGLADTLGAAHALARYGVPRGGTTAFALPGETRKALAALPVECLRLESGSVLLLKRLGLRRLDQLYNLPRQSLMRRFRSKDEAGQVLLRLDQALGVIHEPRRSMGEPPLLTVSRSFSEPLISSPALQASVEELCQELSAVLDERALGVRAARLSLYRADGSVAEVFAAMSAPCREAAHMLRLLNEKLAAIDAGFGIDLLRLDVVRAEKLAAGQDKFAEDKTRHKAYPAQLIDQVSNRLGAAAVTLIRPQASYIPERAEVRLPALAASLARQANGLLKEPVATYEPPWPYSRSGPRRPPFLLPRPEPIEVVAEVPDGPPAQFTWRRVMRRVIRAEGPERIAPEWWQYLRDGEGNPARSRDYYMIEDEAGASYWVFRYGLYGREEDGVSAPPSWFLHGLFA